jgi:hypothetical protein
MYDYFTRGTRTYFIYNGKYYYNDNSLGEAWKYHDFAINMREYQKAYRSK